MGKGVENYALIGDRRSAALVAHCGTIDWPRWPHFDSNACFVALLARMERMLGVSSRPPNHLSPGIRRAVLQRGGE